MISDQLTDVVVLAVDELPDIESAPIPPNSEYTTWDCPLPREWFASIIPAWLGVHNWAQLSTGRFPTLSNAPDKSPEKKAKVQVQALFRQHAESISLGSTNALTHDEIFEGLNAMDIVRKAFSDADSFENLMNTAHNTPPLIPLDAFDVLRCRHYPAPFDDVVGDHPNVTQVKVAVEELAIRYWAKKRIY